jgi:BRCA1-associated protein
MVHLEAGKTLEELSLSDEVKDGTVLPISIEASSSNDTKGGRKVNDEG